MSVCNGILEKQKLLLNRLVLETFVVHNFIKFRCLLIGCGRPTTDDIENGGIEIIGDSFEIGSALLYTCETGFATEDPSLTACSASFAWSLDLFPPTCSAGNNMKSFQI